MDNFEDKKEQKNFKITHKMELLFWLVVICVIVALSSLHFIAQENKNENTYKIFLDDVYGLIVGSPVRMMGIEVGHVTKIKPLKDCVYVKFVLTNPEVYIPQGTQINVEFTGLAGSKSLELYLPDDVANIDKSTPMFEVLPVKRIRDALGLLNVMYKKLMSIIYTTSSFNEQLKTMDMNFPINDNAKDFTKYADQMIDEAQYRTDNIHTKIEQKLQEKEGKHD